MVVVESRLGVVLLQMYERGMGCAGTEDKE